MNLKNSEIQVTEAPYSLRKDVPTMRILQHRSLSGLLETDNNDATYLRCAEASLAALDYECDHPSRYLYNALSHLSKIKDSGINLRMYNHLYYATDKTAPESELNLAKQKLAELSARLGVPCGA